ncbi:hypothetical protein V5T82_14940 [Magnetovibrio sp. PR-2]|uniref:hypothetical protein n=1 Tax=Magnetovibrio sp. PR-2 TaxID=3120356 RepID=UPI002FCE3CB5
MMIKATPLFSFALNRPIQAGLVAGMVLLLADQAFSAPLTDAPQTFDKYSKTCSIVVQSQERKQDIPTGLLHAISLAESGRWMKNPTTGQGENIAWPWTVTTGGKGYFLPNRLDAIAFVKSLQADGVENIDVGCMQINLKYHPKAFGSVEQAFDARKNAAYAAKFLSERKALSHSWMQAAGDYHSFTPELNQKYIKKVTALWHKTTSAEFRTAIAEPKTVEPAPVRAPEPGTLDSIVTASGKPQLDASKRINRSFKIRRNGMRPGQEIANRLNALKPGAHLMQPQGQSREELFAQRRQEQLASWRLRHAKNGVN